MCVAFEMRDVYEFVFSKCDEYDDIFEIEKARIIAFQSTLEREITAHASESPHYKYVHFASDRRSVEDFFESNRTRFLDFGSTVVFNDEPSTQMAERILRKYDDDIVTNALRKARSEARLAAIG